MYKTNIYLNCMKISSQVLKIKKSFNKKMSRVGKEIIVQNKYMKRWPSSVESDIFNINNKNDNFSRIRLI